MILLPLPVPRVCGGSLGPAEHFQFITMTHCGPSAEPAQDSANHRVWRCLEEITLDEHGYLFATLPANTTRTLPTIGFIAHVDTSPDVSGKNVNPRIVENYNGTDIVLSAEDHTLNTVLLCS